MQKQSRKTYTALYESQGIIAADSANSIKAHSGEHK